jgi:DNA transformation protein
MAKRSEFVDHVVELMRGLGAVQAKPMFGAWGLFNEGLCFATVAEDALYLKSDAVNGPRFDEAHLAPFVYESKMGERIVTSYRQAPAEALDDAVTMALWAREGYEAALRAAHGRPPGKPRRHTEA